MGSKSDNMDYRVYDPPQQSTRPQRTDFTQSNTRPYVDSNSIWKQQPNNFPQQKIFQNYQRKPLPMINEQQPLFYSTPIPMSHPQEQSDNSKELKCTPPVINSTYVIHAHQRTPAHKNTKSKFKNIKEPLPPSRTTPNTPIQNHVDKQKEIPPTEKTITSQPVTQQKTKPKKEKIDIESQPVTFKMMDSEKELNEADVKLLPETYLTVAVVVTLCFNCPVGIVAMLFSFASFSSFQKGEQKEAIKQGRISCLISIFGMVLTIFVVIGVVLYVTAE
ncbi:unnamed protein product [Owenia fusiformis]|uniref:Uncharacterized protein n=1 Tax=Owenia fusiformis TaxID=6347 RepID=A0A8J1Y5L6_OWEFU|nr:unnamed protein product [Owenia fusiformis]